MLHFIRREGKYMLTECKHVSLRMLDWIATEAKAAAMTDEELHFARLDCYKTAAVWNRFPENDPHGNGGYYSDEGSVYVREQNKRREARRGRANDD